MRVGRNPGEGAPLYYWFNIDFLQILDLHSAISQHIPQTPGGVGELEGEEVPMPHTYVPDVKAIIDALSKDDGLILEEKLIVLGMIEDHVAAVTKQLEDELAGEAYPEVH